MLMAVAALIGAALFAGGCSCSSIEVPNVQGLTQTDAEKAINDAGFTLGTVTEENSDTVYTGNVISQTPAAKAKAAKGDKVNIVVSLGKKTPKQVTIPDLKNMTQTQAEDALAALGLVPKALNPEATNDVEAGKVFKQSPAALSAAVEGSTVTFTVALGALTIEVPNVVGMSETNAKTTLDNADFGIDKTTHYSDTVAAGNVIAQNPAAGTKTVTGTKVTIDVSLGKKPADQVAVPNLQTLTLDEAKKSLESAGLKCVATGDQSGTVTAQDPKAGTKVNAGSTVTITLTGLPEITTVPDLSGMTFDEVSKQLKKSKLLLSPGGDIANGVVIDQNPLEGTKVNTHTTVIVTFASPMA